ncbi:hypothetical protein [Gemmobacter sp. 24YEA27]|uniref:hypothetical protein n=1 Tax=Gemmobacter sp. 24YEA27 TaxID=3040672 RepID=UPI0024B32FA3|nr:hypothetical protein [Gemmobacter sp. 24YEA27]
MRVLGHHHGDRSGDERGAQRSDNAPYDYVGTVKPMGKVSALAALLDCTDERIDRVRNFAALHENVVLSDAAALEF